MRLITENFLALPDHGALIGHRQCSSPHVQIGPRLSIGSLIADAFPCRDGQDAEQLARQTRCLLRARQLLQARRVSRNIANGQCEEEKNSC